MRIGEFDSPNARLKLIGGLFGSGFVLEMLNVAAVEAAEAVLVFAIVKMTASIFRNLGEKCRATDRMIDLGRKVVKHLPARVLQGPVIPVAEPTLR